MGNKRLVTVAIAAALVFVFTVGGHVTRPDVAAAASTGTDSCVGTDACTGNSGDIGDDSCNGTEACYFNSGSVGSDSCNDFRACDSNNAGTIGNGSCNGGQNACRFNSGTIGNNACNGTTGSACYFNNGGSIGSNSCNVSGACDLNTGSIGANSCNTTLGLSSPCSGNAGQIGDCEYNDADMVPLACTEFATIRVTKVLVPFFAGGRFDLLIDGVVHATAVGHGGTTGTIDVAVGSHTVEEFVSGSGKTTEYRSWVFCQNKRQTITGRTVTKVVASTYGTSARLEVLNGDEVSCTITNMERPRSRSSWADRRHPGF